MGRNQFARHRGVAPNAVTKAVRDGRIAKAVIWGKGGKIAGIKWRLADELWTRNTDLDQAIRANGGALPPEPARSPPRPAPPGVWTDRDLRALGRAVALARVDCLEQCMDVGFIDEEPLRPDELLDLIDVYVEALANRLAAAVGVAPSAAVMKQLLDAEQRPLDLTLDQVLELARAATNGR